MNHIHRTRKNLVLKDAHPSNFLAMLHEDNLDVEVNENRAAYLFWLLNRIHACEDMSILVGGYECVLLFVKKYCSENLDRYMLRVRSGWVFRNMKESKRIALLETLGYNE